MPAAIQTIQVNSRDATKTIPQDNTDGYAHVFGGVAGAYQTYILDVANGNAGATNQLNSVAGFKGFFLVPITPAAVAGLTSIIVGWSSLVNDATAINVAMAALASEVATPATGGIAHENVDALFPLGAALGTQIDFTKARFIEGTLDAPIRTIAVRSTGAAYPKGVKVVVVQ